MRIGVRTGPVWWGFGGGRKRRRDYTAAQGLFVVAMIAVVYLLVSGGAWVVAGWALLAVSLVTAAARSGRRASLAQRAATSRPAERTLHKDRG